MAKKAEQEESKGSIGVSVRLPEHLVREIDRLADQDRRSRGSMIRLLLEDALTGRKGDNLR